MQLTVGFKLKGKAEHVVAGAQDALVAALKVKTELSRSSHHVRTPTGPARRRTPLN